jgi:hypothetical protein
LVEKDGWLFCKTGTSVDAVGTRDAVNDAWNAMVAEQSEAWRKQG